MTAKRLFQPLLLAACLTTAVPAFSQQPSPTAAPTPPAAPVPPAANTTLQPTAVDASANEAPTLPMEGLVRLEVFTLSQQDARTATRKFPKHTDLYAWLAAELEKEKPIVKLERLMVLRVRAGQKSKLEEIEEYPAPTGFSLPLNPQSFTVTAPVPPLPGARRVVLSTDPPVAASGPPAQSKSPSDSNSPPDSQAPTAPTPSPASPPAPTTAGPAVPWPIAPPVPTTFTFQNTGWTTEIELTFSDDGKTADLNLAPEFVRLLGLESHDSSGAVQQPIFETSKLASQIITQTGKPTLAGTLNPPIDPAAPGIPVEPVNRLLFITVTDPR